ncbi:MAG: Crp/Fnr family transcriptional regulator [Clostridia bacterium]|nr:Crp/Fnr family transcriptional regulator [Clostridia bacterium]
MALQPRVLERLQMNELFSSVNGDALSAVLETEAPVVADFRRGDVIFPTQKQGSEIGFLLRGGAQVAKKETGIIVNRLKEGDVFGCSVLFISGAAYSSEIVALRDTRVLFFSKAAVTKLMQADGNFAVGFIRYLSQHIAFLNKCIDNFTGGSAESRLANYLCGCFEDYKTYEMDRSMSQLAVSLDIGRASLYRAFDRLAAGGAVQRDGRSVRLVDKAALLSFIQ